MVNRLKEVNCTCVSELKQTRVVGKKNMIKELRELKQIFEAYGWVETIDDTPNGFFCYTKKNACGVRVAMFLTREYDSIILDCVSEYNQESYNLSHTVFSLSDSEDVGKKIEHQVFNLVQKLEIMESLTSKWFKNFEMFNMPPLVSDWKSTFKMELSSVFGKSDTDNLSVDYCGVSLVGFFNEETNEITVKLKVSNDEKVLLHGVVAETNMYSVIETIGDICKEFSDTFYTVESSNSWLAEK